MGKQEMQLRLSVSFEGRRQQHKYIEVLRKMHSAPDRLASVKPILVGEPAWHDQENSRQPLCPSETFSVLDRLIAHRCFSPKKVTDTESLRARDRKLKLRAARFGNLAESDALG